MRTVLVNLPLEAQGPHVPSCVGGEPPALVSRPHPPGLESGLEETAGLKGSKGPARHRRAQWAFVQGVLWSQLLQVGRAGPRRKTGGATPPSNVWCLPTHPHTEHRAPLSP